MKQVIIQVEIKGEWKNIDPYYFKTSSLQLTKNVVELDILTAKAFIVALTLLHNDHSYRIAQMEYVEVKPD